MWFFSGPVWEFRKTHNSRLVSVIDIGQEITYTTILFFPPLWHIFWVNVCEIANLQDYTFWDTLHTISSASGASRRQDTNFTKVSKQKVKILEFGNYIWNHHEKCIQISTNMPGIHLEMCKISRILRIKTILHGWWNLWPRAKYISLRHLK